MLLMSSPTAAAAVFLLNGPARRAYNAINRPTATTKTAIIAAINHADPPLLVPSAAAGTESSNTSGG
jgi:hypothetical protein